MKNKKIMFHVTRQYMKLNKKRTITTLVGIIFMVVLMTCVFVGKDTALSYLEQVASAKSGSWHVSVFDVDLEQYEKIKELNYISETAVSKSFGYTDFEASGNELRPYLYVKGYSQECFDWMNIELESGRYPENDSEIVISIQALKDGADISIGDVIEIDCFTRYITGINEEIQGTIFPFHNFTVETGQTLEMPLNFPYWGENKDFLETHESNNIRGTYRVVGFISVPSFETKDSAGYTAIAYTKDEVLEGESVNVTAKFYLDKLDAGYSYLSELGEIVGNDEAYECNDLLLAFSANSSDSTINVIVNFLMVFFIAFIMVASVILIYNVFNMSFDERRRYIGMLSSVGATRSQRRSSVYYEAFSLWLIALPVGVLTGAGLVKAAMSVLSPHIADLVNFSGMEVVNTEPVSLKISLNALCFIAIVSAVTVMISAWIPARKIGKIGPIESIRGNVKVKTKSYKRNDFFIKKGNPEALVAANNLKRQRAKSKSTVRAIAVFMVILLVTTFGANATIKMVYYRLVEDATIAFHRDGWDYTLTEMAGSASMYHSLKEEIEEDAGVESVQEWYYNMWAGTVRNDVLSQEYWDAYRSVADLYYEGGVSDELFGELTMGEYNTVTVIGVDQDTFEEIAKKSDCNMEFISNPEVPSVIVFQSTEISTDNISFENYKPKKYQMFQLSHVTDKEIGDTIPLQVYNGQKDEVEDFNVTVAGFTTAENIQEYMTIHSEWFTVIMNMDTATKLCEVLSATGDINEDGTDSWGNRELHIKLNGNETDLAQKLQALSEQDNAEFYISKAGENAMMVSVAEAVAYIIKILAVCFVILTSVICILNLYNSIWGRVVSRKQEFGTLKSLGMTRKQMAKMLFYENVGLFLKGTLWSGVISIPVIYLLRHIISGYLGYVKFAFPWMIYLLAVGIAAVSLGVITVYCYRRNGNEIILEELRRDTV
ncbi:MAG: ABC transporter permease [Lachnospiraceae bacterium]|nr:ABC transporter permease [Lachnospiraceae bacterium]